MHVGRPGSERGFALFEVLIVTMVAAGLLASAIALMTSANRVSEEDRLRALVESTHRRSLEYVTNVLRNASTASLQGFDPVTEIASAPQFRRPTGSSGGAPTLGDPERLVWRPSALAVPGIASPGDVWLVTASTERVAAARVPLDGFSVRQDGRGLVVRLTTYNQAPGKHARTLSSEATVCLRN